ncbi:hypothetical protein ACLBWZ_16385 [Brucellaceae bacterium C25G]
MPRVRFMAAFDWKPKPQVTIAYPEGFEGLVTTPCAEKAIAANKAVRISNGVKRKNNRVGEATKEAQPDAPDSERSDTASA